LPVPPKSFAELAASDLKIVIQDPRSSTPGLGLLLWVKAAHGVGAAAVWEALADNIVTVTPGWSEAYGLFLDGEADMVLSYTTSPAYHLIAESDDTKAAALFEEGHYLQVEVAGKLAATDQPELADRFLAFMGSEAFQSVIPTTNWMYPAVAPAAGLPEGFDRFRPAKSLLMSPEEAEAARDAALAEWQAALAK
jgi:thiamine transport system substrate-binding protein